MGQTSSHCLEPGKGSRHVNSSNCDDVSGGALLGVNTLGEDFHGSGDMTDGDLVGRLLDFNFLETHKLARF